MNDPFARTSASSIPRGKEPRMRNRRRGSVTSLVATLLLGALVSCGARSAAQTDGSADAAQVALDELAIMELAARFENTFDAGDVEGHLEAWVDDLTFESPFGNYQGKDAYRTWVTEFRSEERRVGKECRSRWSPHH